MNVAQVPTRGLVIAAFDHRTSRTGDPNVHTHVTVANRVQGEDGKWRTLDSRMMHQVGVTASETYNTAMEDQLRTRLGVAFRTVEHGEDRRPVREIAGVDEGLVEVWPSRSSAIEARYDELVADYRSKHAQEPARAVQFSLAQQATLNTRPDKQDGESLADMLARVRAEGIAHYQATHLDWTVEQAGAALDGVAAAVTAIGRRNTAPAGRVWT